jgi:hypothetical protein
MELMKAYFEYAIRMLIVYIGLAALLLGIGILIWQIIHYMQYAVWKSLPLMAFTPENVRLWFQYPQSWIGLSKFLRHIFEFVPASLALVLLGFPLLGRKKKLDALKSKYSSETGVKVEDIDI